MTARVDQNTTLHNHKSLFCTREIKSKLRQAYVKIEFEKEIFIPQNVIAISMLCEMYRMRLRFIIFKSTDYLNLLTTISAK